MTAKAKATQPIIDALEGSSKISAISFKKLPAEESEYAVWLFGVVQKIRARLIHIRSKEGMQDEVDRYINALKNGLVVPIHEEIETIDAMAAVGISEALDQHPKRHLIERELMNDDICDTPRSLKTIANLVLTGTEMGKQNLALNELFELKYDNTNLDAFIAKFKSLGKESGYDSQQNLMNQLMIAKIQGNAKFTGTINSFKQLPKHEQTLEKLILQIRETDQTNQETDRLANSARPNIQRMNVAAQLFDAEGNAYVLAGQSPNPKAKAKAKGAGKGAWRTPPPPGECPYHINLRNGCKYENNCPSGIHNGEPGWGYVPAAKAKPPAPRPIAPPVQQGNVAIAPPAQPGNVDQNAAALVNQAEMSAQSSIFGQLIETMFTIVEQRFTALIEKTNAAKSIAFEKETEEETPKMYKVGKMKVLPAQHGFFTVTKGARDDVKRQVGSAGSPCTHIGEHEALSDDEEDFIPYTVKARSWTDSKFSNSKKSRPLFIPKSKRRKSQKSTTGVNVSWKVLKAEISRAKEYDALETKSIPETKDIKYPRIRRFDEKYPNDIHDSINVVIDEMTDLVEKKAEDIWDKYFCAAAPEAPLLVGMVGDSGASEHNLTGPLCSHIPLDRPVALKTAAGTIQVNEGACLDHPIFGQLQGLSIKGAPNLLSLGRLVEQGYEFHWKNLDTPHLIDKNGKVISFRNENYVPVLYPVCYGNRKVHDEFTHLGPSENCDPCKLAKMKEKAYIKRNAVSADDRESFREHREKLKFNHHLTFDSFGQVPRDIDGNEFGTVGFCSNTKFLYFAPKKTNDPDVTLGNLKGFLTKEALKSVNSVHTDNGSEFKGEFDEYLLENHIQHQWGTPNRPVSNGLIERQVGEIKRGIRTILLESKLPVAFWSYAAAVWVFNYNRNLDIAKYLPQYNRKPLRFGQRIYAKKSNVAHTFEPTAASAIFIGYTHCGVLAIDEMYLKATGKVKLITSEAFTEPTQPAFPGFPGVIDPTELNVFLNCDVCGKSRVPEGHPINCKACLNKGKRGRPGTHSLTIGCELARCTCKHEFEIVGLNHPLRNDLDEPGNPDEDEQLVDQGESDTLEVPQSPEADIPVEIVNSPDISPQWSIYDQYDIDYVNLPPDEAPSDDFAQHGVRNLIDRFDAIGTVPVGPSVGPGAANIDDVQPRQTPHRGLYSKSHSQPVELKKMPVYSTVFSHEIETNAVDLPLVFQSSGEEVEHHIEESMFYLEPIHRNDPRYYSEGAIAARQLEFNRMVEFKCFDLTKPIEGKAVPRSATKITPIMLTHYKDAGTPNAKYKGRFVADGRKVPRHKQFSPPISLSMKRSADLNGLLADESGSEHGVIVADMTNGYLHAELDPSVEIYMRVPKEYQTEEMQNMEEPYVKVLKAMYGLPSAGFDFARYTDDKIVGKLGYSKVPGFPSMYVKCVRGKLIVLGVYVDDLYMTGDLSICRSEMQKLSKVFTVGTINDSQNFKFVGIERVSQAGQRADHMCPYIIRLLTEYKQIMGIGVNQPLRAHTTPGPGPETSKTPGHDEPSVHLRENPKYDPLSLIAGLLYLARCARPDISFGVNFLARAVHRWSAMHDRYLKQLFSYLEATYDLVLHLPSSQFCPGHIAIRTLSDADFAGDLFSGKSTSGFCTFLENVLTNERLLVDWGSKLQVSVAGSTPDAELAAVHRATLRSSLPTQILVESFFEMEAPIFHEADNKPCINTIENGASDALRYVAKTQRVSIPMLNEIFNTDSNALAHVDTERNASDIFTKFLSITKHQKFSRMLGLKPWQEVFHQPCPF